MVERQSGEADTVVMLSSELISKITEEYFNKTMFKQKVEIVDSKPTETGYMFSIAFVQKVVKEEKVEVPTYGTAVEYNPQLHELSNVSAMELAKRAPVRSKNGKFTKVEG